MYFFFFFFAFIWDSASKIIKMTLIKQVIPA